MEVAHWCVWLYVMLDVTRANMVHSSRLIHVYIYKAINTVI